MKNYKAEVQKNQLKAEKKKELIVPSRHITFRKIGFEEEYY